jgi:methylglutaconyl-CoA hydratase
MLQIERRDPWVVLRLDRPEVGNALNDEVVARLLDVLAELRADAAVRGLVVTGTGKIFSAGADLNWMRRMQEAGAEENRRDAERTATLFAQLYDFPRPVVAAVNGPARGGGVGLVASCDFAIASSKASFAFTEVRLGLLPAMISPFVLRKMGESRARRLFLTGENFTAEQAREWGLVDEVVGPERLDERVSAFLDGLRPCGPTAVAEVKRLVREVRDAAEEDLVPITSGMIADIRATPEAQEGMAAFLEKRPPRWAR